jgi:hypothetical protein
MTEHPFAESGPRVAHHAGGFRHLVAHLIEAEGDDLEEQGLLAGQVVVDAGFRHFEGAGDLADRCTIESAVTKDLGGGSADFRLTPWNPGEDQTGNIEDAKNLICQ